MDPHGSKPYAVTVLEDGDIQYQGKLSLGGLVEFMRAVTPDLVAVEDQYLSKNYKVAKLLSWSAGKVMGVSEILGVRCEVVNVATWKARFKVTRGKGSHLPVSVSMGGLDDDDLASSHLIAIYAAETLVRGT